MEVRLRFENFAPKAYTWSLDDNRHPDVPVANLMKKYSIHGTFNLNSGYFPPLHDENEFFTKATAVKELTHPCIEIAMHGVTHPYLEKLSPEDCEYEIAEDMRALEELFGVPVKGLAYPFGTYSEQVKQIAKKCGAVYGRPIDATYAFDLPEDWFEMNPTCHHCDERVPELLQEFLNMTVEAEPKVFFLWGHPNEFDACNKWEFTEQMFKTIASCDDIWCATNMEIYNAVKNFEALEINETEIKNPTDAVVWVNADGKDIKLMPSETVVVKG